MTHKLELYKCKVCGNIVEIAQEGVGVLICCDEAMKLLEENRPNKDDAHYAHIEKLDDITYSIKFNHPMDNVHYIKFIEIISNDKKYIKRKDLELNEAPELSFKCECKEGFYVRLYCNLHGVQITHNEVQ